MTDNKNNEKKENSNISNTTKSEEVNTNETNSKENPKKYNVKLIVILAFVISILLNIYFFAYFYLRSSNKNLENLSFENIPKYQARKMQNSSFVFCYNDYCYISQNGKLKSLPKDKAQIMQKQIEDEFYKAQAQIENEIQKMREFQARIFDELFRF